MTENISKKSFNQDDVIHFSGVLIGQRKLKTNYIYDIDNLLSEIHK